MGLVLISRPAGGAMAPWLTTMLIKIHVVLPFLVMGGLIFISTLLSVYLPETKDMVTKDTLDECDNKKFDGEQSLDIDKLDSSDKDNTFLLLKETNV